MIRGGVPARSSVLCCSHPRHVHPRSKYRTKSTGTGMPINHSIAHPNFPACFLRDVTFINLPSMLTTSRIMQCYNDTGRGRPSSKTDGAMMILSVTDARFTEHKTCTEAIQGRRVSPRPTPPGAPVHVAPHRSGRRCKRYRLRGKPAHKVAPVYRRMG